MKVLTVDEFDEIIYSTLSVEDQIKGRGLLIYGCIMMNEEYVFGINLTGPDKGHHHMFIYLDKPEIAYKYSDDDYKLSKEDCNKIYQVLTERDNAIWNGILDCMGKCIKSDDLTDDYIKVDLSKIPTNPPDYRLIKDG